MSLKEATDSEYGFVGSPNSWIDYAQIIYPSDFAIANGAQTVSEINDHGWYNPNCGTEWWLRSPNTYGSISTIDEKGFSTSSSTHDTSTGVVPALCIDLSYCTPVEGDVYGKAKTKSTDPAEAGIPLKETILEFAGTPYEECGTEEINNVEYKLVKFGDFPQSRKITAVEVNEKIQAKMGDYTYYKGSDGEWYAKGVEGASDVSFAVYFKVEPIVWRVLTDDYNGTGKKLLLAEKILMNRSYYDFYNVNRTIDDKTIYPNNYEHSRVRAYLNGLSYLRKTPDEDDVQSISGIEWNYDDEHYCTEFGNKGFLNTAFTMALQDQIAFTEVDNSLASTTSCFEEDRIKAANEKYICPDTYDKVFLLSEFEVTNPNYGFEKAKAGKDKSSSSTRAKRPTAFALYQGLDMYNMTGIWNLRSPSGDGDSDDLDSGICHIYFTGTALNNGSVSSMGELFETHAGVVPAICLE